MSLSMTNIAIVHTKGGVGKTTSAIYLATAATRAGLSTVVLDADAQQSAKKWSNMADSHNEPLPFRVIPTAGKRLVRQPCDLTIIDTPPGTLPVIQEAISMADLVLIPCGASPMDHERVYPTLDMMKGHGHGQRAVVLLTQVDLRARLWEGIRGGLTNDGVDVLKTMIARREDVKRAYGKVPDRLYGYADLLTELELELGKVN